MLAPTHALRKSPYSASLALPLKPKRLHHSAARSIRTGAFLAAALCASTLAFGQQVSGGSRTARPIITQNVDQGLMVSLEGNVRKDLTPEKDLGVVEDSMPMNLTLVLKRTPAQQAELDTLIAQQQQPGSPEYHKWLTPQEFGERFGAAQPDIQRISVWLQSQGFKVKSVLNNASMITFQATAGGVRNTFRTEIHYWNVQGGKYAANAQDPQIPAALSGVIIGVRGLNRIPAQSKRVGGKPVTYDFETHTWHDTASVVSAGAKPRYLDGGGNYNEVPKDFYTIYDVNKVFATGNLGAGATISLPEPTDMQYGTVNSSTGKATGGDVATFRSLFGVAGTLNMVVMHGAGTVTCGDPGVTAAVGEAALDAEWANALAPNAKLIFMSCDNSGPSGDGFNDALTALIDNNISDVISSSYGSSELTLSSGDYASQDTLTMQAATQGQTFLDAAGDAGSADDAQNTTGTATMGLNVDNYAGTPLTLVVGGTDFQDKYDADRGGPPQSNYWASANTSSYSDALGYIPETPWNASCADSIIAYDPNYGSGDSPAAYCGQGPGVNPYINGAIVGGGGGFSVHYATPSYQTGTPGLSSTATKRAVPDVSLFAANGFWGHAIIQCDSTVASTACTSPSTFESAGGTSFAAPQMAGIIGLLVTATGERQGFLNPAIYALARAQYAKGTACYANGQTNNIGVTTSLPVASCIFHDVTTGNNDEPCAAGSTQCYVQSGASYGLLSVTGSSSLTVGYPAGVGYDEATGLGSIDVYNFITNFNQGNTSGTNLTANPTTIAPTASTSLTATVTGGQPAGATGQVPALTGSVSFKKGATVLNSCTLASGTCSAPVAGSALTTGANSITAVYAGNGTYPTSTSSAVTVTVTAPDTTGPTVTLTGTVAGPPKQVVFSSQDNAGGSGLASVTVTNCTNCTFSTGSFTQGTSSAVTTTATKTNQALSSSVTIVATDVAGNSTTYDPVDLQLESKGVPTEHGIRINSKENKVLISNGTPGMFWLRFIVNGRPLPEVKLSNGENTVLNIARYLRPGPFNEVNIIADGKDDATSWIVFTQP